MRETLMKATFTSVLAAVCIFAGLALIGSPAAAFPPGGLSNCPAPCISTDGMYFTGTCDTYLPNCHLECKVYQATNGTRCQGACFRI